MKTLMLFLLLGFTMANAKIKAPNEITPVETSDYKFITNLKVNGNIHFHELNCYSKKNEKKKLWSFSAAPKKSKKIDPKLEKDVQFQTSFFNFVKIQNDQITVGMEEPPFTKYELEIKTGKVSSI